MTGSDRRSVLAGLALIGLGACNRDSEASQDAPVTPGDWPLDLSALEARHGGRIGLCARDRNRTTWRAAERFNYCSTFKLFLAAATLERIQHKEETGDRAIPITAADMVPHAPVTEPAIGESLTIDRLMQAVVEVSDNPAANILIREMGGLDVLRAWYRGIGDTDTRVDRLEPMLNRRDGDMDTARPDQIAANLSWMLTTYQPLAFASDYQPLWTWLIDSPTGPNRIKAGVPQGWTVAHKTGTGGTGQTNDIGVIHPPVGEPIAIAVYYDAPSSVSEADRDAVVAEATRLALARLGRGAAA